MSDSSSTSSSSEEAESDRERREADEDFREMCARAVVRLRTRRHYYEMLQDTLRREIDLMGANWDIPFLPNDAFIIRKSKPEELPGPDDGAQYAKDLLRNFLSLSELMDAKEFWR